jgi:hypothetical protein
MNTVVVSTCSSCQLEMCNIFLPPHFPGTGVPLRVYAVEKNPNAVVHIQQMLRREGWGDRVSDWEEGGRGPLHTT